MCTAVPLYRIRCRPILYDQALGPLYRFTDVSPGFLYIGLSWYARDMPHKNFYWSPQAGRTPHAWHIACGHAHTTHTTHTTHSGAEAGAAAMCALAAGPASRHPASSIRCLAWRL